jgi:ABC-type Fe3+ transport system permease subunit
VNAKVVFRKIAIGGACGAAMVPCVAFVVSVILGGIYQVAPCHGGDLHRSFTAKTIAGLMFGALGFTYYFALPSMLVGLIVGGICGAVSSWWGDNVVPRLIGQFIERTTGAAIQGEQK